MSSILTKVLMGLMIVTLFPLLYFSAGVLNVQNKWRASVEDYERAIAKQKRENYDKLHGDAQARVQRFEPGHAINGTLGIDQYQTAVDNLKFGRGRFWYANLLDASIDTQSGRFKLQIQDENIEARPRQPLKEHGIRDKSFLYAFALPHDGQTPAGSRYVGEFVVDGLTLDENGVPTDADLPLKPSQPLIDAQWEVIRNGGKAWVVYEHMPIDDHAVFSDLPEGDVAGRVPASVAAEYVHDGKEPTQEILDNPRLKQFVSEDKDTGKKIFLRPLRDYQAIFRNVVLRLTEMNDRLVILKKEKEFADRAKVKAEELIAKLDARRTAVDQEKQLLAAELKVVETQRQKMETALAEAQQSLQARLAENKRLAADLAAGGSPKSALGAGPQPAIAGTP